jgi:hypothetical protein
MNMKENGEYIFYIIYSPETCKYLMTIDPYPPAYMRKGYYMTALPLEPWGIKFKGSYKNCSSILNILSDINYN